LTGILEVVEFFEVVVAELRHDGLILAFGSGVLDGEVA
jgi:hypothetical protein